MDSKEILLVEDNPDDVDLTLRAFKKADVPATVAVARDGVEALERLMDAGRPLPDLVLLDINLPLLNGFEVLKRIRSEARTRLLPVVILTSSREEVDLVRGYSEGANSYVRKPVDYADFLEAARQLSLYWLLRNEGPPRGRR
jgi:two-component system response regulator